MATDSEVKELLSALLAEVKSNSMNQKKIFAKIKSMEKEIQEIKGEKEIQQIQQESDRIAQEVSNRLRTLTDAVKLL
jgi:predicted secreted Zn-dependent protease